MEKIKYRQIVYDKKSRSALLPVYVPTSKINCIFVGLQSFENNDLVSSFNKPLAGR